MLSLIRNQSPVFYKMYLGEQEIIDDYGNRTGSFAPMYSELKTTYLCVSPNKGNTEAEMFGSIEDYDRVITTADITCEIDEDSILWLDGADTAEAHNYFVKRRSPWKNSITFAVKKVEVSDV